MATLEDLWWRGARPPPWVGAALSAGEALFRLGLRAREGLLRAGYPAPFDAGVPVVSVGNLAVGGAGKTPVALEVARRLLERGRRVAVLSRGYGARLRRMRLVSDGERLLLSAAEAGDEPFLVARRLPVAVLCGPRRTELARRAVDELGADALVLDDGFQHRALRRDLDLVVLDATDPVGNGHLLPRGPGREPWSALARAQLAWLSRVDQAEPARLEALRARVVAATGRPPVESRHAPVEVLDGALRRSLGLAVLRGRRVLLLCALARPEGFRRTLRELGAEVAEERVFRDHHAFTDGELREAEAAAGRAGCEAIALTEKDAVRLTPAEAAGALLRVVRIDAKVVAGGGELAAALDALLGTPPASGGPPGRERGGGL